MSPVLAWGIELIAAVQRWRTPFLDGLCAFFTALGEEYFLLLLLPLVYWCVDRRLGARVAVFYLCSQWVNTSLKDLLRQPRPYDLRPELGLLSVPGYGLPSGHAQTAAVVWGTLAAGLGGRPAWIGAGALVFLVGFSRIYFGVHFPTDVLAGWAIGAVLLAAFLSLARLFAERPLRLSAAAKAALAAVGPLLLVPLHPVADTVAALGALSGAGAGAILAGRYAPFAGGGPLDRRVRRFLVGALGAGVFYFGLRLVFPAE
ncbi:MAG: phosphatase PAP2 family protein, partial [Bacteroidota bacterium]